jgi:hypothetical protein
LLLLLVYLGWIAASFLTGPGRGGSLCDTTSQTEPCKKKREKERESESERERERERERKRERERERKRERERERGPGDLAIDTKITVSLFLFFFFFFFVVVVGSSNFRHLTRFVINGVKTLQKAENGRRFLSQMSLLKQRLEEQKFKWHLIGPITWHITGLQMWTI